MKSTVSFKYVAFVAANFQEIVVQYPGLKYEDPLHH